MERVSFVPRLVSFTVAPEIDAPLESETVPTMEPNLTWAFADAHKAAIPARTRIAASHDVVRRFVAAPCRTLNAGWRDTRLRRLLARFATTAARRLSMVLTFFVESGPIVRDAVRGYFATSLSPE
jgi:hypothetical protein